MSNQSFEYDLVIRVAQAEQKIAEVASKIERDFGQAASAFDIDTTKVSKKFQEIESRARDLGKVFRGSFDFDAGKQISHMDQLISKAHQLADAVGGNASNASWIRMQKRMEDIGKLGEKLRSTFSDPISSDAINQLERKLREVSEGLKGKNTPTNKVESATWTKAIADAEADFAKAAPARLAAYEREKAAAITAANEIHDIQMRTRQEDDERAAANHSRRMQEYAEEYAAVVRNAETRDEAAKKLVSGGSKPPEGPDLMDRIAQDAANQRRLDEEANATKKRADIDHANQLRDLEKKNIADKTAEENQYLQTVEDGQRRIIGEQIQADATEKKLLAERAEWKKRFTDSDLAGVSKLSQANDRMYDRLTRSTANLATADAARYQGLNHYETALSARHADTNKQLLAAADQREEKGERWFRNELERIRILSAAERDRDVRQAGETTNRDLASFAGGGRAVSNMFQVQQAFEDAQYAGLRGAANNIAMMAANMGGSGGIIALGAIMGAQLATSAGLWDVLNESLNGFLWKLKSVTEEEEKQIKLTMQMFDLRQADAEQIAKFGPGDSKGLDKKIAENQVALENTSRWAAQYERADAAYTRMAKTAEKLDGMMPTGFTLGFQSSPEESNKNLDYYRNRARTGLAMSPEEQKEARRLIKEFEDAKRDYEANAGGAPISEKGGSETKKKYEEEQAALAKLNAELKTNQFLKESMVSTEKSYKDAMSDSFKEDAAYEGKGLKGEAKAYFKEATESSQKAVDTLQDQIKLKMALADASADAALSSALESATITGNYDAVNKILKELAATQAEYARQIKEATDASIVDARQHESVAIEMQERLENLTQQHKEQTGQWQEELSLAEKMLSNYDRLIQADEQRLRLIEDQISAFEEATAKQAVGLQAKQIEHEGKLEAEAYKEKARLGKEAFQKWADQQREIARRNEKAEVLSNAHGKGDANPDHMVKEKYARWKDWFDGYVKDMTNRAEAADRHNLKRIERQAELEVKAKYKEYSDAEKVKEDQMRKEAQDAMDGGDLIKADQKRKQLDKLLKERADAAAQQVGKGTKEEGKAAYEEWKAYNDKIVENQKAHAEVIAARQQDNIASQQEQAKIVETMKNSMQEMSQMTIGSVDTEARLLKYLVTLNSMKEAMAELARLSSLVNPGGGGPGAPAPGTTAAYATGTDYVPQTGLALIHKGEIIVPAKEAQAIRNGQAAVGGGGLFSIASDKLNRIQSYGPPTLGEVKHGVDYWSGMEARQNARSGAPPREGPFFSDQNYLRSAETIFGAPAQIMKDTGIGEQLAKDVATAINDGINAVAPKIRDAIADYSGPVGGAIPFLGMASNIAEHSRQSEQAANITARLGRLGNVPTPSADLKREEEELERRRQKYAADRERMNAEHEAERARRIRNHDYNSPERVSQSLDSMTRRHLADRANSYAEKKGLEQARSDLNKRKQENEQRLAKAPIGPVRDYNLPLEQDRHDTSMAETRESASRSKLKRMESAQRMRAIEEDGRRQREAIQNRGPESTPDYIARRRREIRNRSGQYGDEYDSGMEEASKLPGVDRYDKGNFVDTHKGTPARAAADLNSKIWDLANGYNEFQSRIVDEIEKTHEMVNETKGKVTDAGHEREKMHQKKKAGLDLENQGWKQKHSGGEGGLFRTGDGEYISPESQALNDRLDGERRRAEQLKRARRLSGQSPSQVEQGDVQDAMKLEQQLERSAAQKKMLEAMEAVKVAEVTQANELAAALERAAAAKELLSKAGSGGYGVSGAGLGMGGGAGGAMGGMAAGGGGGLSGQSLVVNNTMNATMTPASPASVFAAMSAAAQINNIRRR